MLEGFYIRSGSMSRLLQILQRTQSSTQRTFKDGAFVSEVLTIPCVRCPEGFICVCFFQRDATKLDGAHIELEISELVRMNSQPVRHRAGLKYFEKMGLAELYRLLNRSALNHNLFRR